jgi:DNA polymerase-3 subunit alpha
VTHIDPIKYKLLFERFLNPERCCSNVDLDFDDNDRWKIIEYLKQKYGEDHVVIFLIMDL